MRMALAAGELRGARVDVDEECSGIEHRLGEGEQHVGEVDAGDDVDAVALDHLVGQLTTDVRLRLVIGLNDLGGAAAQFVADAVEAELEAIEQFLAQSAGWSGEGRNEADLDRLLRRSRQRRQDTQNGSPANRPHPILPCFRQDSAPRHAAVIQYLRPTTPRPVAAKTSIRWSRAGSNTSLNSIRPAATS